MAASTHPIPTECLAVQKRSPARVRWASFFAVLAALALVAVTLPIVYNLNQQLKEEDLDHARRLWQQSGLSDYDLTFAIRYDREQLAERHIVLVRGGKAVFAMVEGEIVHVGPALGALLGVSAVDAPRQRPRDMPTIFAHIAELLRDQEQSGGKNFLVVAFDPKVGYPRRIVRRVRHSSTREEWQLRLWKAGELQERARRDGGFSGDQ